MASAGAAHQSSFSSLFLSILHGVPPKVWRYFFVTFFLLMLSPTSICSGSILFFITIESSMFIPQHTQLWFPSRVASCCERLNPIHCRCLSNYCCRPPVGYFFNTALSQVAFGTSYHCCLCSNQQGCQYSSLS